MHADDNWDPFYKLYQLYEQWTKNEGDHNENNMGEYSHLRGKHDECFLNRTDSQIDQTSYAYITEYFEFT